MAEKFSLNDVLFNPIEVQVISAEIKAVYEEFH